MTSHKIPTELRNLIDLEETDFVVKSKRNHPKKSAYSVFFFSMFWNLFVSIFVVTFIGPIIMGKEVNFKTNNVPTTASLENWKPLLVPSLIIGLFAIIGVGMLIYSFILFFQKGGLFVGTETRFIKYRNGVITVTDWEQFSGNVTVKSKNSVGDLELQLRTGKSRRRKKGATKFVHDVIYLSQIKRVFEIEKKCRIRIQENDPNRKKT